MIMLDDAEGRFQTNDSFSNCCILYIILSNSYPRDRPFDKFKICLKSNKEINTLLKKIGL